MWLSELHVKFAQKPATCTARHGQQAMHDTHEHRRMQKPFCFVATAGLPQRHAVIRDDFEGPLLVAKSNKKTKMTCPIALHPMGRFMQLLLMFHMMEGAKRIRAGKLPIGQRENAALMFMKFNLIMTTKIV